VFLVRFGGGVEWRTTARDVIVTAQSMGGCR